MQLKCCERKLVSNTEHRIQNLWDIHTCSKWHGERNHSGCEHRVLLLTDLLL